MIKNASGQALDDNNYQINNNGDFEIFEDQSSAANPLSSGDAVVVTFDAPLQKEIIPFTGVDKFYKLKFSGMNNFNKLPVVLDCFKSSIDIENTLALNSKKAEKTRLLFTLVADKDNNYYKERML